VIAPDFAEWLENRLKDTGLSGSVLTLEVAEDCAEQYFKQLRVLRDELRRLHCGFAICHFGDRPNSERMLHHLAPDYVKLDSILIDKLTKDKEPANHRAITSLTEQARAINALVVADGVSTAPQMASIWQFGVALAQGDVVQEPSPGLDFDFKQFAA
jgi:EAL domain-containing protein (putative c-di-GMP-specific phosphodiesterase class I)